MNSDRVSYHGRMRSRLGRKGPAIFKVRKGDNPGTVIVEDDDFFRYGIGRLMIITGIGEPDSNYSVRWYYGDEPVATKDDLPENQVPEDCCSRCGQKLP